MGISKLFVEEQAIRVCIRTYQQNNVLYLRYFSIISCDVQGQKEDSYQWVISIYWKFAGLQQTLFS